MRKRQRTNLAVTLPLALVLFGCGDSKSVDGQGILEDAPIAPPNWIPLQNPRSAIPLPAFQVGDQGQLSGGCWNPAVPTVTHGAQAITWDAAKTSALSASLKASFIAVIVDANLDAALVDNVRTSWELQIEGISYATVDAATITPNFQNSNCLEEDLQWFTNQRTVITEGVQAQSLKVSAETQLDAEQGTKLNLAIDQFNAKFGAGFSHATSSGTHIAIEAHDVFIGASATSLVAKICSVKEKVVVDAGADVPLCDGAYVVRVTPASVPDRYTLLVTPSNQASGEFDFVYGRQQTGSLGSSRVVFADVAQRADKLSLNSIAIWFVGASGAQ